MYLKRNFFKSAFLLLSVFFSVVWICGCSNLGNNYLTLRHLVDHFTAAGIPITEITALQPNTVHASEGIAAKIGDGYEIGMYKYNITVEEQKDALNRYREKGYIMLNGLKFQAFFNGSFMLIGVEKNQYRDQILKAFESFQSTGQEKK